MLLFHHLVMLLFDQLVMLLFHRLVMLLFDRLVTLLFDRLVTLLFDHFVISLSDHLVMLLFDCFVMLLFDGISCYCLQERLDEYRRLATMGVSFGIESSILDPEETKKVFPLIDADVIQGSLYSPGDGVVDPSKLSNALKQFAVKGGAQVCLWYQGFSMVQGNPEKLLVTYLVKKLYVLWNHEFVMIFTKPLTPYSCRSIPLYYHSL